MFSHNTSELLVITQVNNVICCKAFTYLKSVICCDVCPFIKCYNEKDILELLVTRIVQPKRHFIAKNPLFVSVGVTRITKGPV